MQCPCDPTKKYSDCCKKAHQDIFTVTTAEVLMRSRYSAFVLANIWYLQKSHHSSTRPSKDEKRAIEKWAKSVDWLKLDVKTTTGGSADDDTGTVVFKAFFIENGAMNVIHENSTFCKENKHWVYLGANE